MSKFITFQEKFDYYYNVEKLRKGQSYMNALHFADSDIYNRLPDNCDCFYDDRKICNFLEYLIASDIFKE